MRHSLCLSDRGGSIRFSLKEEIDVTIRRPGISALLLIGLVALTGCASQPNIPRTVVRLTATGGPVVVTATPGTSGASGVTPAAPANTAAPS